MNEQDSFEEDGNGQTRNVELSFPVRKVCLACSQAAKAALVRKHF